MANELNVGVVGAGWPAQQHIKGYRKLEGVRVRALCDADAARLQRVAGEFEVERCYTSFEQMLEREPLDAVSVCTPNFLHCEMSVKALERGKHVLCEKPMAMNAAQARRMREAAGRSGRVLMVCQQRRFQPEARELQRRIAAGEFGALYFARAWWTRRAGIPGLGGWFTQKQKSGGGVLIDIGVHMLDLAMWMLGFPEPREVSAAHGSRFGRHGRGVGWKWHPDDPAGTFDVEDYAAAFVRFDNGAALALHCSWASHIKKDSLGLELWGETAGATLGPLEIFTERDGQAVDLAPAVAAAAAFDGAVAHFISCARDGEPPLCPPEQSVRVMELIDRIYEAGART
jgi:predicted dehydrogenase